MKSIYFTLIDPLATQGRLLLKAIQQRPHRLLSQRYYTRLLWKPRTALAVAYLLHEPDVQVHSRRKRTNFDPQRAERVELLMRSVEQMHTTNLREQVSHGQGIHCIPNPWWIAINPKDV